MPSNYRQIYEENVRRYGEATGHLELLGRLYTNPTHFIYELLQNTEDAGSTRVQFHLFSDRLEMRHNGRPFNEKDVRGICGVAESTKADDPKQIGKFGIGFKSVYAYTKAPEIHSIGGPTDSEHFWIEYYVRPIEATVKNPGVGWTTLLILPLNREDKLAAEAEIAACLKNLTARTLLFLRRIEEIEYVTLTAGSGAYLRETKPSGCARQVTVIGKTAAQTDTAMEEWLVFSRAVAIANTEGQAHVEIAYQLQKHYRTGQLVVTKLTESPVVVSFPTEKETRLGFLIQGPYRTTPARDNLLDNNSWNIQLIAETAILLSETLQELRRLELLNVSSLQALPIDPEAFRVGTMFRPLFEAVHSALLEKHLLPADDGSYVSAKRAKLARNTELRRLLSREQLQQLYESPIPFWWLTGEITLDRTPLLRAYLLEVLQVEEVTAEKFAQRLTLKFIEKQDDAWLVHFYNFLFTQEALWRMASSWEAAGLLNQKPFIRLEGDKHTAPYLADKQPSAFLPGAMDTDLPTVKRTLASDPRAAEFFRKLGLRQANDTDEIRRLVQVYQNSNQQVSLAEHKEHIRLFVNHYLASGDLSLFNGGKNYYLFYNENCNRRFLPATFYLDLPYRETGLSAIFAQAKALKLHWDQLAIWDGYLAIEGFADFAIAVGVLHELPIEQDFTWNHPQCHEFRNNGKAAGKQSIDVDYTIKDIALLLDAKNFAISKLIWQRMATAAPEVLQARYRLNAQESTKVLPSSLAFALRDHAWIPDAKGNFHKPADIDITQLHPDFIYDDRNGWLTAIGFCENIMVGKQATLAQREHALALGIENLELVEVIRQIDKDPALFEQVKAFLAVRISKGQPEFPEQNVSNPKLRRERLFADIESASHKDYEVMPESKRISATTIDPSTSLKNQYKNEDGYMVCQLCHKEMPFKKRNNEYYFEAVEVLPGDYLTKEHEAQFLALCPLCAAMYKEFVKHDKEAAATLHQEIITSYEPMIPVRLGHQHATIRFVAKHYHDLKIILEHENSISLFESATQM